MYPIKFSFLIPIIKFYFLLLLVAADCPPFLDKLFDVPPHITPQKSPSFLSLSISVSSTYSFTLIQSITPIINYCWSIYQLAGTTDRQTDFPVPYPNTAPLRYIMAIQSGKLNKWINKTATIRRGHNGLISPEMWLTPFGVRWGSINLDSLLFISKTRRKMEFHLVLHSSSMRVHPQILGGKWQQKN